MPAGLAYLFAASAPTSRPVTETLYAGALRCGSISFRMCLEPREKGHSMRFRNILLLGLAGAGLLALPRLTGEPGVSMHELDWAGDGTPRSYRSAGHALHHALELARLSGPIARVYVLRALTPEFREQIMIVTASANQCPG